MAYDLDGQYTGQITAKNGGGPEVVFQAPVIRDEERKNMEFNMNNLAMQLNYLNDEMKAKLPPTDARLRPDQRYFEAKDVKNAQEEQNRLVGNERKRR